MSSEEATPIGPAMIVATGALTPPKLRIGRLGANIVLPRTIPAVTLAAVVIGGLVGFVILTFIVGFTLQSGLYGLVFGAMIGAGLVTFSPLRGESLGRWLGLQARSRIQATRLDGGRARYAVGICYVPAAVIGRVGVRPGAVNVTAGRFDERGVRVPEVSYVPRNALQPEPAPTSHRRDHPEPGPSSMEAWRASQKPAQGAPSEGSPWQ